MQTACGAALAFGILLLSVLTASMHGLAASYAKETELLYRRKKAIERELGEIRAEVKRLKSPAEVEARIAAMHSRKGAARGE